LILFPHEAPRFEQCTLLTSSSGPLPALPSNLEPNLTFNGEESEKASNVVDGIGNMEGQAAEDKHEDYDQALILAQDDNPPSNNTPTMVSRVS
jgi:hypothetical protein